MIYIIILLGIILRVWMLLSVQSLWGDEFFSIALAPKPFFEILRFIYVEDVHPPVYYLVLSSVTKLFGAHEVVYRGLSCLAGVGTVIAIYFLAKEIFGRQTALLASFFTAISPYWLQSSNEIRSYSLFAFFVTLGTFFFLKSLNSGSRWNLAYVILAVVTIYTEHYAWFWLMALVAARVYYRRRIRIPESAIFVCVLPGFIFLIFQAVFTETVFDLTRVSEYLNVGWMSKKIVGIVWHFVCGYYFSMLSIDRIVFYLKNSPLFWISALTTIVSLALAAVGFVRLYTRRYLFILFSLVLFFPLLFLSVFYPIRLDARYLAFAAPFFFVLMAHGLIIFGDRKHLVVKGVLFFLIASVSFFGSVHAISIKTDSIHKENYIDAVRYVLENARENDIICGLEPQFRYYKDRLRLPQEAGFRAEYADLTAAEAKKISKIWLLNYINMHKHLQTEALGRVELVMNQKGFTQEGDQVKFGGEEGLTSVTTYKKLKR